MAPQSDPLPCLVYISRNGAEIEYYEDFPVNLIHEFPQHTGHQVEATIVMVLQYGMNFSGPGHDIFRGDRATGEPCEAHLSNFLHPVFHHFKKLPTGTALRPVYVCWFSSWYCQPRKKVFYLSSLQSRQEKDKFSQMLFY